MSSDHLHRLAGVDQAKGLPHGRLHENLYLSIQERGAFLPTVSASMGWSLMTLTTVGGWGSQVLGSLDLN